MKKAIISDKYQGEYEMGYLDTHEALLEYVELDSGKVANTLRGMMRSSAPDHYSGYGASIVFLNMFYPETCEGKSIVERSANLDNVQQEKYQCMAREISAGGVVLVNKVGGYCFFRQDFHTLVKIDGEVDNRPDYHYLPEGATHINLENDPKIENYTYQKLGNKFAYIKNLRSYDTTHLTQILKRFVDGGGTTLFQYTTGDDLDQMHNYTKCCLDSGIKDFEFHFNAGDTIGLRNFRKWLNEHEGVVVRHTIL